MRLDEDHIGLYVADAMGRGLPASSLLSIFVKKSLTPKEILGRSYRLVPPGEVLDRLNRELLEPQSARAAVRDHAVRPAQLPGRVLTFARAAHPHPLYVPAGGRAGLLARGRHAAWRVRVRVPGAAEDNSGRATS